MSFWELLKIEFIKVKRSKIIPLIFIAPLLVVASGVANLHSYFTPEYTNAWAAMFIQSELVYSYYLLPFSMIVYGNGCISCSICYSRIACNQWHRDYRNTSDYVSIEMVLWAVFDYASERNDYVGDYCTFR